MGRPSKYSPELRRRAVDEVLERKRKIPEVASSLGIGSAETLRKWVRQAEADRGLREAPTSDELAEIKRLRKEVADQQRTIEILKAATAFFRSGDGSTALKVRFVAEHRDRWPVAAMCRTIGLPERTFHAAVGRAPSARAVADVELRRHVRRVWEDNFACYGAHRLWRQLHRDGVQVGRCRVERLMRVEGICGVRRGKKRFTTIPDGAAERPADLVDRRFVADRPDQLWVADITYASTWQGWLYVAFILDVHSRVIVGWQIADHLRTDLVLDALEMALWRRQPPAGGLTHHSDRGGQYVSIRYSDRLDQAGVAASVGSRGDSYDNAMAEALNGSYKTELVKLHGPWRTRADLERATIDWVDWYNAHRLHSELGDIPPLEHEAAWHHHHPAVTAA